MLNDRQSALLRLCVEAHLDTGRPVGSKALAEREDVEWSPSTVRAELATLEDHGLLSHPHTSAGRVPTELGYRTYVDALLAKPERLPAPRPTAELTHMRREVEETMQDTVAVLGRVTDLIALATAPALDASHIHRVEVLSVQPRIVLVVVITTTGSVAKRVFRFERDVDPGLVEWAGSYLHERLAGLGLGARMLRARLQDDPELGESEAGFIAELAPAFDHLQASGDSELYIEGTTRLLSSDRAQDVPRIEEVASALEERASLLALLRAALEEREPVQLWIGRENPRPELRSVSMVGASYGLGWRNLGTVGVIGPMRMDYATAISSVRAAAGELSRYFEGVYEE